MERAVKVDGMRMDQARQACVERAMKLDWTTMDQARQAREERSVKVDRTTKIDQTSRAVRSVQ